MVIMSLEEGWGQMQRGIDKLVRLLENDPEEKQFDADMYMALYTTIYNMCTLKPPHDYSEILYARYRESLEAYLAVKVHPALLGIYDERLARDLVLRWNNHKLMVRWLSRFFNYLDRYYISRNSLPPLIDVGLACFRDIIYNDVCVFAKDVLLKLIEREREGELVDRALLKSTLGVFVDVGLTDGLKRYQADFEEFLLVDTVMYYRVRSSAWVEAESCPDYLVRTEECLHKEGERADGYLHASTKEKMLKDVYRTLLSDHQSTLMQKENSGVSALLRDEKTDDLARMYRLFSLVPNGLEPVADFFEKHVEAEGSKLVREVTDEAENKKRQDAMSSSSTSGPSKDTGTPAEIRFMRSVIELHDKFMTNVMTCFADASLFHKAFKNAFESFYNKPVAGSSSAELMASFCDDVLKKGGTEKLSEDEVEETLDRVAKLLAYVSDKDMFAEFYRKKLARRLLYDRSLSDDHERSLISRLKQQCGAQFTSKMEGMLTDLMLAREKQAQFKDWLSNSDDDKRRLLSSVDVGVTLLTTGFWPTYKSVDLTLPQEMVSGIELFKEFYESGNKNRRLTWIYSMGTATIKCHFDARPIELSMSTMQAVVCLLFNDAGELSYREVQERTGLHDDDLIRLLHSLSCTKYKILCHTAGGGGDGKSIRKDDHFCFNRAFTSKASRIKIPLPPVDEKKKVVEDVDKERKHVVDATIVRVMKSRKVLQHQQLVIEVVQQLSRTFNPDFKLIKKRIEDLISREYLERDREDAGMFRYLA